MKKKHIHADLIVAWAYGALIQQKHIDDEEWEAFDGVWTDSDSVQFRLRPSNIEAKYLWIGKVDNNEDGNCHYQLCTIYMDEKEAKDWYSDDPFTIEYFKKADSRMEFEV